MTDATVLVTGCGAPGFPGTCWSLRAPDERDLRVVGADMRAEQAGRYRCDAFHRVPPASDDGFVDALVDVCETAGVDVLLPQVTRELLVLASNASRFRAVGTAVALPGPGAIDRANDKGQLMDLCARIDVPAPETTVVDTADALTAACRDLGYPERRVVVKPPVSNGSRGMRILAADRDEKRAFYEEKPTGVYTTLDSLRDTLGERFPRLLVMEHLPGDEYTVDAYRPSSGTGSTTAVPRRRDEVRAGISFQATVTRRPDLVEYTDRLARELDLAYAFGFQFKEDADGEPKLLECNPRVQGTMVTSALAGANVPYASMVDALGDDPPTLSVDWDTAFYRYWGGLGVADDAVVGDIGGRSGAGHGNVGGGG